MKTRNEALLINTWKLFNTFSFDFTALPGELFPPQTSSVQMLRLNAVILLEKKKTALLWDNIKLFLQGKF